MRIDQWNCGALLSETKSSCFQIPGPPGSPPTSNEGRLFTVHATHLLTKNDLLSRRARKLRCLLKDWNASKTLPRSRVKSATPDSATPTYIVSFCKSESTSPFSPILLHQLHLPIELGRAAAIRLWRCRRCLRACFLPFCWQSPPVGRALRVSARRRPQRWARPPLTALVGRWGRRLAPRRRQRSRPQPWGLLLAAATPPIPSACVRPQTRRRRPAIRGGGRPAPASPHRRRRPRQTRKPIFLGFYPPMLFVALHSLFDSSCTTLGEWLYERPAVGRKNNLLTCSRLVWEHGTGNERRQSTCTGNERHSSCGRVAAPVTIKRQHRWQSSGDRTSAAQQTSYEGGSITCTSFEEDYGWSRWSSSCQPEIPLPTVHTRFFVLPYWNAR